jgi:hypothetical protein
MNVADWQAFPNNGETVQSTGRRSFLGTLASFAGIGMATSSASAFAAADPMSTAKGEWDLSWIKQLKGKHKQVFAVGDLKENLPLHVVVNYLDAHRDVFGLEYPKVNTVVGIARSGYPINAVDAIWAKYELGRRWEIKDPKTGEWAVLNVFMEDVPAAPGKVVGVRPLMQRGTIFWQCNNALGGIVRMLSRETSQTVDAVRAELIAGFNPGVRLVPAHTMALGLVQEQGCTYEQIG